METQTINKYNVSFPNNPYGSSVNATEVIGDFELMAMCEAKNIQEIFDFAKSDDKERFFSNGDVHVVKAGKIWINN